MNATHCPGSSGPQMNGDISGPGVRVSFYLQTLFLSCLSARSGDLNEITGALYTLLATNTAMAVTALILGLKPEPEITFHDAIVVFYLLYISWVTVFFTLPACARFPDGNVKMLHFFSIVQSYTVFAFALALLITAHTFGYAPECNHKAVVVLFRPFEALTSGRIVCWVMTVIVVLVYTGILIKDHMPPANKRIVQQWIQKRVTRQVPKTDGEIPMVSPDVPAPQHQQQRQEQQQQQQQQHQHRTRGTGGAGVPGIAASGRLQYHARRFTEPRLEYDLQIAWHLVIEIAVVLILWGLTVMNTELLIRDNRFQHVDGSSLWQFGQVLPMFLVILPFCNLYNAFGRFGLRPQS